MSAVNESEVIIIGEGDGPVLGASVPDNYIRISSLLGMPLLQKNMSPVRFRALTGLDLMKLVGKKYFFSFTQKPRLKLSNGIFSVFTLS